MKEACFRQLQGRSSSFKEVIFTDPLGRNMKENLARNQRSQKVRVGLAVEL